MFWALLRAQNESESGPKHIYARKHKLYCYINGTDKWHHLFTEFKQTCPNNNKPQ